MKLRENVERDRRQTAALESEGWRVLRLWEHELVNDVASVVPLVNSALSSPAWTPRPSPRVVEVRPLKGENVEVWIFVGLREEGGGPEPQRRRRAPRRKL